MKIKAGIILMNLTLISGAYAYEKELKTEVFNNIDCKKSDSCDLKKFTIKISEDGNSSTSNYGIRKTKNTYMEGSYEVSSIDKIRDYAVVQYIQGCVYQKNAYDNEKPTIRFNGRSRDFFGKKIDFVHKKLVIDSFDDDPIYASYSEGHDRHGLYKIKKDESKSVLFDNSKFYDYLYNKPLIKRPIVHFSDMPTGSAYSTVKISGGANKGKVSKTIENASMIFKTCVYKTQDVPRDLGPEDTDMSKAIKCFSWSNSNIYNKNLNKFQRTNHIDKTCLKGDEK